MRVSSLLAASPSSWYGRLLRLPLAALPERAIVPVLSGPLRGARWVVGSSSHGCWAGTYEAENQKFVAGHLKAGDVALDLGAHVGFFTLLMSRMVGARGVVIACEPHPESASRLRRHLALNGCSNVRIREIAISDHRGELRFLRSSPVSQSHLNEQGDLIVPSRTLDELIAEEEVTTPAMVKIDVEGAEAAVLRGAERLLASAQSAWLIATHGWEAHRDALVRLQRCRGFEVVEKLDERSGNGSIRVEPRPSTARVIA